MIELTSAQRARALQQARPAKEDPPETTVVTIRMTTELHAALKELAHANYTSLNKLCVAALTSLCEQEQSGDTT